MGLILLTMVGAILGWLASIVVECDERQGILRNIGLGVISAVLTGLLIGGDGILWGISAMGLLASVLVATVSLVAYNLFRRDMVR